MHSLKTDAGTDVCSLPQMVLESINKCDVDIRKELCSGVLLTGGTSVLPQVMVKVLFPGLAFNSQSYPVDSSVSRYLLPPVQGTYGAWIDGSGFKRPCEGCNLTVCSWAEVQCLDRWLNSCFIRFISANVDEYCWLRGTWCEYHTQEIPMTKLQIDILQYSVFFCHRVSISMQNIFSLLILATSLCLEKIHCKALLQCETILIPCQQDNWTKRGFIPGGNGW